MTHGSDSFASSFVFCCNFSSFFMLHGNHLCDGANLLLFHFLLQCLFLNWNSFMIFMYLVIVQRNKRCNNTEWIYNVILFKLWQRQVHRWLSSIPLNIYGFLYHKNINAYSVICCCRHHFWTTIKMLTPKAFDSFGSLTTMKQTRLCNVLTIVTDLRLHSLICLVW